MKNYIIADTRFNDEAAAREQGLPLQEYNQMIIENWNAIVKEDDTVYLMGCAGISPRVELRKIFSQLKGHIIMTQYNKNEAYPRDDWKSWGIDYVWDVNFVMNDGRIYFPYKKGYNEDKDSDVVTVVTADSDLGVVFKNNQVSLEAKYWDFLPICVTDFPDIVNRIKEYGIMEDDE